MAIDSAVHHKTQRTNRHLSSRRTLYTSMTDEAVGNLNSIKLLFKRCGFDVAEVLKQSADFLIDIKRSSSAF